MEGVNLTEIYRKHFSKCYSVPLVTVICQYIKKTEKSDLFCVGTDYKYIHR
jgi:hypothetical protein